MKCLRHTKPVQNHAKTMQNAWVLHLNTDAVGKKCGFERVRTKYDTGSQKCLRSDNSAFNMMLRCFLNKKYCWMHNCKAHAIALNNFHRIPKYPGSGNKDF